MHRTIVMMHVVLHLQLMLLLFHAIKHRRLLLLPNEDIVNHGAATEKNPDTDQDACHNRWR